MAYENLEDKMDKMNGLAQDDVNASDETVSANPFYGTAKTVMERYNHCTLCGANLHFTHQTDFHRNLTQEIARCPECGVKNRQVLHKLQ